MKKLSKIFVLSAVLFSSVFFGVNVSAASPSVSSFTVSSPITVGTSTTGTFTCSNAYRVYIIVDNDWTTGHFVSVSNLTNPTHSGSYTMPLKASVGSHVIKIMCQNADESLDSGWTSKSFTVQATEQETLTKPSCPFSAQVADRIIVNFNDSLPIVSYDGFGGGVVTSKSTSVNIPAGNYKVSLFGYDTSTDRASQSQPNEKFFVKLLNGGSLIASSDSTSDLQDNVKTAKVEQVVNNSLNVSSAVNTVVAMHSAYLDSSSPNSLYPKCAAFDKISSPSSCSIPNFTASDTSITQGESSTLTWNTSNCTSVILSGSTVANSGSKIVWPTQTTTYTLIAVGTNGGTQTRTVTVYVDEAISACSISSFTASDASIEEGDSTTLRWNTNGCNRVKISDIGNVSEDGSERVYPNEDTTYTLTAYDSDGVSRTRSVRIYVDNNNNSNCSIDSFTASTTYINSGDHVTLRWRTTDCDNVSFSDIGHVSLDGSRVVYPSNTITYVLRADGNKSRSIQINVGNQIPIQLYNTNVVTTVATNISQTGAQVNGLITSSNYTNANVYFQYGTSVNLGSRTASRPTNGNTNFSEFLTNLSPNTIYFFQALSDGTNGVSRGSIMVFKTLGYKTNYNTNTNTNTVQTVKQVVVQGPTVYGSQSPVILRIENLYQSIGVGDIIDYIIYYKNISSSTLTHPMVQVFIPQGITLTNSSRGTYSNDNKTLSVPIEDLIPNAEGVIYLQARVDSIEANLAQIVTTAILVYTNPNGAQENAMAYVLNSPRTIITDNSSLGAAAFFGNIFGTSFCGWGWLLLLILIILIILLARSLYNNNRRNTVTTTTQKTISQ